MSTISQQHRSPLLKTTFICIPSAQIWQTIFRQYRRANAPGATYFFTVVAYNRQHLFKTPETLSLLRQYFGYIKRKRPFFIDAIVVLPDHLHCLWTLPPDDTNFSTR